jgi:hypothetical protein
VSAISGDNIENLFTYMAGQMLLAMEEGRVNPAYSHKV